MKWKVFSQKLQLNRNSSFLLNFYEEEFLRLLNQFVDTDNIEPNPLALNLFPSNKKLYKGHINEKSFNVKKRRFIGNPNKDFTYFVSFNGKYEVIDKNIIVNIKTQISPALKIYFIVMGLLVSYIMLTIPNGWIFLIISIIFIYLALLYAVVSSNEIAKIDFIYYFKTKQQTT